MTSGAIKGIIKRKGVQSKALFPTGIFFNIASNSRITEKHVTEISFSVAPGYI